ncbi:MAG: glucosamine-6-phosphate deaminase [Paludibacteraceae bacterium]|nr:glucosamine-6-phosphate deaminase [Paludibacteraceae bacterium]
MRPNLSSKITLRQIPRKYYQPNDVLEMSSLTRFEKIPTEIFDDAALGAKSIADEIAALIKEKQARGEKFVLGLTCGRSCAELYAELVQKNKQGLSFKNVVVFNAYEYYPLVNANQSCLSQLKTSLLDHVDILPENIYSLNGQLNKEKIVPFCKEYENKIETVGGIDYLVMGISDSGNLGFNESGSQMNSQTRLIMLDANSRSESTYIFGSLENVPRTALTIGIKTILNADKVVITAWGENKANIVKKVVEEKFSDTFSASYLQTHSNVKFVLDTHSASELTRISHPWLVTSCEWDDKLIRRAIVWLCLKLNKPILKLTNKDYNENGLSELLALHNSAYNVNIKIFNDLQHTITGWPGGKPNADDTYRPERAKPYPKKVLVFSPHPDDDVISMGGTLCRLVEQNHDVHIAYETSGNIAVNDEEVMRFLMFLNGFKEMFDENNTILSEKYKEISSFIKNKKEGEMDSADVRALKGLIRRGEARLADLFMGVNPDNIHFLNLPFYETGAIKKNDLSQADVDIVKELLQQIQPQQIYVAGDLADPHGTHKVCLDAVLAAIDDLKGEEWLNDCNVWMYRGAWMEWEIDHIEMAVPISPEELRNKRNAILRHQSQMESAPFLGNDERLFWQRSEERNRATAELYSKLGLASYEAIEAFVKYIPVE